MSAAASLSTIAPQILAQGSLAAVLLKWTFGHMKAMQKSHERAISQHMELHAKQTALWVEMNSSIIRIEMNSAAQARELEDISQRIDVDGR